MYEETIEDCNEEEVEDLQTPGKLHMKFQTVCLVKNKNSISEYPVLKLLSSTLCVNLTLEAPTTTAADNSLGKKKKKKKKSWHFIWIICQDDSHEILRLILSEK